MKATAKVFIWIGMIIQFFLIYPIIVGVFALKRIDEASTKEDLRTMGIIATLFCSLLGGIFMLSIKDEEFPKETSSSKIYSTVKENISDQKEIQKTKNTRIKISKTITTILIYVIGFLLLVSTFFAIGELTLEYDAPYSLVIDLFIIGIFTSVIILYYKNNKQVNKTLYILFTILLLLCVPQIVISALIDEWPVWVCFGLAVAKLIISLSIILLNIIVDCLNKKTPKQKVVKNNLESELNEIKRLLETKIITEEEYNKMRSSVISKYYK